MDGVGVQVEKNARGRAVCLPWPRRLLTGECIAFAVCISVVKRRFFFPIAMMGCFVPPIVEFRLFRLEQGFFLFSSVACKKKRCACVCLSVSSANRVSSSSFYYPFPVGPCEDADLACRNRGIVSAQFLDFKPKSWTMIQGLFLLTYSPPFFFSFFFPFSFIRFYSRNFPCRFLNLSCRNHRFSVMFPIPF